MERIDSELKILKERFNEMGIENENQILKNQFAFKDFFAQSIYKQGLKDGIINKYPKSYFETQRIEIDESKIWNENNFFAIISEWENKIPKLKFENLGNYLLFFKSIFFKEYQIGIQSISLKQRLNSKEMNIKLKELNNQNSNSEEWNSLERYFYLKGIEIINRK